MHRQALLRRLDNLELGNSLPDVEVATLRRKILEAPPDRLMLDVANARSPTGSEIGKRLLLGYAWHAFWDLTDMKQREALSRALGQ